MVDFTYYVWYMCCTIKLYICTKMSEHCICIWLLYGWSRVVYVWLSWRFLFVLLNPLVHWWISFFFIFFFFQKQMVLLRNILFSHFTVFVIWCEPNGLRHFVPLVLQSAVEIQHYPIRVHIFSIFQLYHKLFRRTLKNFVVPWNIPKCRYFFIQSDISNRYHGCWLMTCVSSI